MPARENISPKTTNGIPEDEHSFISLNCVNHSLLLFSVQGGSSFIDIRPSECLFFGLVSRQRNAMVAIVTSAARLNVANQRARSRTGRGFPCVVTAASTMPLCHWLAGLGRSRVLSHGSLQHHTHSLRRSSC